MKMIRDGSAMAGMDPKIDLETYSMFSERTSYTFENGE